MSEQLKFFLENISVPIGIVVFIFALNYYDRKQEKNEKRKKRRDRK